MHAVGAQRLGGESRGDRRVDAARHADDDLPEAVLVDIVPEAERESEAHLLQLADERDDLGRDPAPVRRWSGCADVDDRHRRDLVALPRERPPPHVAKPPADHLRGIDLGEEQGLLESRCAGDYLPLVVQHDRVPVEDELVLAADAVAERDEARVVAGTRDEHLLALSVASDVERRSGEVHEELGSRECEIGRGWSRLPHVLADGDANERPAVLEEQQLAAGCEVALLVEDAVVRQEPLLHDGADLAARADVARVVEIAVEVRPADEHGRAAGLSRDALDRLLSRADEARAQQQVLGRVPRHGELWEDDEVGGVRLRLTETLEDELPVAVEVADDRVDLRKSEPHELSLAVSACQSKTGRRRAQRRPSWSTQSETPPRPNIVPRSIAIPRSCQLRVRRLAR